MYLYYLGFIRLISLEFIWFKIDFMNLYSFTFNYGMTKLLDSLWSVEWQMYVGLSNTFKPALNIVFCQSLPRVSLPPS
jgi:hypothetical protein